jgi:hypothetical protein
MALSASREVETPTASAIDCTLTITKCRASLTSHPARLPDKTCGWEQTQHPGITEM